MVRQAYVIKIFDHISDVCYCTVLCILPRHGNPNFSTILSTNVTCLLSGTNQKMRFSSHQNWGPRIVSLDNMKNRTVNWHAGVDKSSRAGQQHLVGKKTSQKSFCVKAMPIILMPLKKRFKSLQFVKKCVFPPINAYGSNEPIVSAHSLIGKTITFILMNSKAQHYMQNYTYKNSIPRVNFQVVSSARNI